jgi:outer membrane lipoprotein SlyB
MQEAVTTNKRLHPLLTAAAISVTVFSAVGVAALTGVLPHSVSSSKDAGPAAVTAAAEPGAPNLAPAPTLPADEVPMPPAAARSTPAKKPVKKHVAHAPAAPAPLAQIPSQDFGEAPRVAQAPAPVAPAPAGMLGVVESVREVTKPAEKSNGVGPIAGGVAGAVVGNQFGHGMTKSVLTILGAAGGALAGKEIERNVRSTKTWEINVRLDDGSYRTLTSDTQPFWHGGERVRLVDGRLTPAS